MQDCWYQPGRHHSRVSELASWCRMIIVNHENSVGNLAHVHFASNIFSLPLKSTENPRGIFTEHEMFMIMAAVFACIFFDMDPAKSFPLRHAAHAAAKALGQVVEANVKSVKATGLVSSLIDGLRENHNSLEEYGVHMIRRLLDSGLDVSETTWSQVMPTAIAMVPNQAQVVRTQPTVAYRLKLTFPIVHANHRLLHFREWQEAPP